MSEQSYRSPQRPLIRAGRKTKEPRRVRAGLLSSKPVVRSAYFGALESVVLLAVLCFLLWCFEDLWDLAGADAEVSDEGAAVSAAMTGPAASSSRLTTGTSFLNIDRLHVEKKIERLGKSVLQDARSESADIMTGLPAPGFRMTAT